MMNTVCFLPLKNLSESSVRTPPRDKISSLYCLKAICAFIVVLIHSQSWGANIYTYSLLGLAVPCFFAISGYFIYAETKEKECTKAKRLLRKALMYLICISCLYGTFFHLYLQTQYVWQTPVIVLFAGNGTCAHLWYLAALWQALLLFLLLRKYIHQFIFAIPVLIILQTGVTWIMLSSSLFHAHHNLLFFSALSCILSGYTIHQFENRLKRIPGWLLLFFFMFCIIPYEAIGVLQAENTTLTTFCRTLGSFSIVLFCIKHPTLSCKWLEHIGKKHSANIYFYHIIIGTLIVDFIKYYLHLNIDNYAAYLTFLLSIPCSGAMLYVQSLIATRIGHKRLKS